MIWQKKKQVIVAGNREYKETDHINSVQSSLKSHSLWVTLISLILIRCESDMKGRIK